jgi:hypothetical protein
MSVSNEKGKKNRYTGEGFKMKKHILGIVAALLMTAMTATTAFGQAEAFNTNTVAPTLAISATIDSAIFLALKTGTNADGSGLTNHCAISGGAPVAGAYTMSFGTVDALGLSAGCVTGNNVFAPTTPGSTAAVYYTDYILQPEWAGLTEATGTITAKLGAASPTGVAVVIPNTGTDTNTNAGLTVSTWTALTTTATPVVSAGTSGLTETGADGGSFTRFLGLQISPNAAAGAMATQTVTFTMTIQ